MPPGRPANPSGLDALGDLVLTVPRLLDRTRGQAAILRGLVSLLPCMAGRSEDDDLDDGGSEEVAEPTDVLAVLSTSGQASTPGLSALRPSAESPSATRTSATSPTTPRARSEARSAASDAASAPLPAESDLAVQDYDSLAASQVVPRLAVLSPQELSQIAAYESAHRNRQTILNRVAQVLAE